MKGLFWFLAGVASTVYVLVKGHKLYKEHVPEWLQRQLERRLDTAMVDLGRFSATFRTAMAEREAELRNELIIPENENEN